MPRTQPYSQPQSAQPQSASPAFTMASRIKREQGAGRAAEYLAAMEPYLAPAERAHIASQLNLPSYAPPPPPVQAAPQSPISGSMNDPMQLLSLFSMLGGMGAGKSGAEGVAGNPMMLAQLLGNIMGKR